MYNVPVYFILAQWNKINWEQAISYDVVSEKGLEEGFICEN